MSVEDEFKLLVSGYFGIIEMDEYKLKEYILKDIEEYIKKFIALNSLLGYDYREEVEEIKDHTSLKRKLQDGLLVLRKINAPLELVLLIKERLEELK